MTAGLRGVAADDRWRNTITGYAHHMSGGRWTPYAWQRAAASLTREVILSGGGHIIINIPTRHGKSELFSTWTPSWFLDLFPERRVIEASYEAGLPTKFSRQIRDLHEAHPDSWAKVRADVRASNDWETVDGGGMRAAGVGSSIVGRGGDLVIVDDAYKDWEQAQSDAYNKTLRFWWASVLLPRLEPGATVILLMNRWGGDDLPAWIMAEQPELWNQISIPAVAYDDVDEPDPLGRAPGEPLCPERYDSAALEVIKKLVGSRVWETVYQQRPPEAAGRIYKRDWWKFYRVLPEDFDVIIQSWDMSFKETKDSSFVVGHVWGRKGPKAFLLDEVRAQMSYAATKTAVKTFSGAHEAAKTKLVEDAANGPAIISDLTDDIGGFIAISVAGRGDKKARGEATAPFVEAGDVLLPDPNVEHRHLDGKKPTFVHGFIEEHARFPREPNDRVDAQSQALSWLFKRRKVLTKITGPISLGQTSVWRPG